MKAAAVVADILKREGVQFLIGYPVNPIIEAAAEADIRTIIVRQERTGLHMADAVSRVTSGERIGVFAMQHGPGAENSFGGVAQAFGDSVPIVVLPGGYPRRLLNIPPNFSSFLNYQHVTKWAEQVIQVEAVPDAMRRAFAQVRSGRPRPVLVELPYDLLHEEVPDGWTYTPAPRLRTAPDPRTVVEVAAALVAAERPVLYAGQGVHYARAWPQLRELAELLEAPVTTSLQGKSAFPETHPLSLGSGGRAISKPLHQFLTSADLIFGIGCSFSSTSYGVAMPKGTRIIHATLDPADINKDVRAELALVGDADLTLDALLAEVRERLGGKPRGRAAGRRRTDRAAQERVAGAVDAAAHLGGDAALALSSHLGSPAHGGRGQHHHHPRRGQPARPDLALLAAGGAAQLPRLGQDHAAGLRPGARHGRQAGRARQALHQRLGRCRHRLHRHGLRDGGARAHPDPLGSAQQLLDGDRAEDHEGGHREVPLDRHQRQLRRLRARAGRLGRARDGAGAIVPAIQRAIAKTREGTPALLEFITEQAVDFSIFP